MNKFMRLSLLVIYLLAVIGTFVELPFGAGPWLLKVTIIVLSAHVLEALLMVKKLQLYEGPLYVSVLLTLAFGFLHWGPLKQLKDEETPTA